MQLLKDEDDMITVLTPMNNLVRYRKTSDFSFKFWEDFLPNG